MIKCFVRALLLPGLVVLALSCGKNEPAGEVAAPGVERELFAQIGPDTKASVTSSGVVSWSSGDQIAVFTSAGVYKTFSLASVNDGIARFTGVTDEDEVPAQFAIYPASALRGYSDGVATIGYSSTYTYSDGAMLAPMVAMIDGSNVVSFRHLGGMVQVQCAAADIPAEAAQFFLVSNGKKMAGLFYPTVTSGMTVDNSTIGDNSKVTVSFTNDAAAKNFNVPVPVGYYGSIYAAFADADGNKIVEWQVLTDVTVERSDMFVRSMPSDLLRVMSFNIRFAHDEESYSPGDGKLWDERKLVVPSALEKRYFHVMGSQENTTGQIDDILSSLSGYSALGLSNHGQSLSSLGYTSTYETSAIYYKSVVTVLDNGSFDISQTNTRRCNWAKLRYSGHDFYVFNAHLQVGESAAYAAQRKTQASSILTEIKKVSGSYPVILTGDFNCWDASADDVVKYIVDDGTLRDARGDALNPHGPSGTLHYFEADNPTTHRLDYVFVSNGFAVQSFWIDNSQQKNAPAWESDHNPVIVDLSWN